MLMEVMINNRDIGTNSTVVFQTVNANVQLKNSAGALIDEGAVKYYAGAWRDFRHNSKRSSIKRTSSK